MRAKDVVGRKIVAVHQERFWNTHTGSPAVAVNGFELDDGSLLWLSAFETNDSPMIEGGVTKRSERKP